MQQFIVWTLKPRLVDIAVATVLTLALQTIFQQISAFQLFHTVGLASVIMVLCMLRRVICVSWYFLVGWLSDIVMERRRTQLACELGIEDVNDLPFVARTNRTEQHVLTANGVDDESAKVKPGDRVTLVYYTLYDLQSNSDKDYCLVLPADATQETADKALSKISIQEALIDGHPHSLNRSMLQLHTHADSPQVSLDATDAVCELLGPGYTLHCAHAPVLQHGDYRDLVIYLATDIDSVFDKSLINEWGRMPMVSQWLDERVDDLNQFIHGYK